MTRESTPLLSPNPSDATATAGNGHQHEHSASSWFRRHLGRASSSPSPSGHHSPFHRGASPDPSIASNPRTVRATIWGALTVIFVLALALMFVLQHQYDDWSWSGTLPHDSGLAARRILDIAPVIDGHIDLPILVRYAYANNVTAVPLDGRMPNHVDIPRLRAGKVGGFFWSAYVDCANPEDEGEDFTNATWRVRDTLEQIDIARLLIDRFSDTFQLALTGDDVRKAIRDGKIASLIGIEGAHQLGNSLSTLRMYAALGVRYVTLAHICHNAFADSCGYLPGKKPLHGGLSEFGTKLIYELNRLGVLPDLSHTSDQTALQALALSRGPVIWSHSSARGVHEHPRNVPDAVLERIGMNGADGKDGDGVVMVNFAPQFVGPGANVSMVADHVERIARAAGKEHVGIGSDFDGIASVPEGLEDVSRYPALIAELYARGWNKLELAALTGGNVLRALDGAERVKNAMAREGALPAVDLYEKRPDLPMRAVEDL